MNIQVGTNQGYYKDKVETVVDLVQLLKIPQTTYVLIKDVFELGTNLVLRPDGTYRISSGLASYPKES